MRMDMRINMCTCMFSDLWIGMWISMCIEVSLRAFVCVGFTHAATNACMHASSGALSRTGS